MVQGNDGWTIVGKTSKDPQSNLKKIKEKFFFVESKIVDELFKKNNQRVSEVERLLRIQYGNPGDRKRNDSQKSLENYTTLRTAQEAAQKARSAADQCRVQEANMRIKAAYYGHNHLTRLAAQYYVDEAVACRRWAKENNKKAVTILASFNEKSADYLDLHEFTVSEAIKILRERIQTEVREQKGGPKKKLNVITGYGRSRGLCSPINQAVHRFLNNNCYNYTMENDGHFLVTCK